MTSYKIFVTYLDAFFDKDFEIPSLAANGADQLLRPGTHFAIHRFVDGDDLGVVMEGRSKK